MFFFSIHAALISLSATENLHSYGIVLYTLQLNDNFILMSSPIGCTITKKINKKR